MELGFDQSYRASIALVAAAIGLAVIAIAILIRAFKTGMPRRLVAAAVGTLVASAGSLAGALAVSLKAPPPIDRTSPHGALAALIRLSTNEHDPRIDELVDPLVFRLSARTRACSNEALKSSRCLDQLVRQRMGTLERTEISRAECEAVEGEPQRCYCGAKGGAAADAALQPSKPVAVVEALKAAGAASDCEMSTPQFGHFRNIAELAPLGTGLRAAACADFDDQADFLASVELVCCYRPTSSMSHRAGCVMAITGMEPGCHAV